MSKNEVFCPRCGYQNNKSYKYCLGCGYELPSTSDFSSPVNATRTSTEPAYQSSNESYQAKAQEQILFPPPLKSHLVSFVLTLFLGPLGLFYSSIIGGIIMLVILISTLFTSELLILVIALSVFFIPIYWLLCIIWGLAAVSIKNKRLLKKYYRR